MTSKLVMIALSISLNFLLSCQENTEQHAQNTDPIKITPLYPQDTGQITQESEKNKDPLKSKADSPHTRPDRTSKKLPEWILESAIDNAPELLKGIISYLQLRSQRTGRSQEFISVPSFHRLILVGPPGSGKTTTAYAIAHELDYPVFFIGATSLLGHFRNQTAHNIHQFLKEFSSDGLPKVLIIDELHKLFEHHSSEHSDDSQTAASFWLAIDTIEKHCHNLIIIATANNVTQLPAEIKSRFSGKIITIPLPNKKQKVEAFKDSIIYDNSIETDKSVDDAFIVEMVNQIPHGSLRDVKLIVDTAKMFYYAENSFRCVTEEERFFRDYDMQEFRIILTSSHFERALNQLQKEADILEKSFIDQLHKKLEPWGLIFSTAANACILIKVFYDVHNHLLRAIK